jgi:hypothetical protein
MRPFRPKSQKWIDSRTGKKRPRPLQDVRTKLLRHITVTPHGCWLWTGSKQGKRWGYYGEIVLGRKPQQKHRRAHVVSYETFIGPVAPGLELHHTCHQTLCINPAHLQQVTHLEHMRQRKDRDRPHCKYGHVYTPETIYWNPRGVRECKVCKRASYLRRRAAPSS